MALLILLVVLQVWDKVVCKTKTGFLIDSIISISIGVLLLFLVWKDWVKSIIVACALILFSSAWKDFQIFVMRKIANYSRKNAIKPDKHYGNIKNRIIVTSYKNNFFKNRHLKHFPFCVRRR